MKHIAAIFAAGLVSACSATAPEKCLLASGEIDLPTCGNGPDASVGRSAPDPQYNDDGGLIDGDGNFIGEDKDRDGIPDGPVNGGKDNNSGYADEDGEQSPDYGGLDQ